MARGPTVTPEVEALIAIVYETHRKWKAPRVRSQVEFLLRERKAQYGTFPRGWPSLSKIQKTLATVRKNANSPHPEEKTWSVSTVNDDHPLPPEALPTVLRLWIYQRETGGGDLTIREVKWAARLYAIAADAPIEVLLLFVRLYGMNEKVYELTGNRLDTMHALDLFLFSAMTNQAIAPARVEKVLAEREQEAYRSMEEAMATDQRDMRKRAGKLPYRHRYRTVLHRFIPMFDETPRWRKVVQPCRQQSTVESAPKTRKGKERA